MRFATLADREQVEAVVNDPRLRLWNSFDGAPLCDARKYLTAPSFAVLGDEGCFLARCIDPGRYVIHTNLLPHCRGADAIQAAQEALALAFLRTDARELLTMCPATAPQAKWMARRMGFQHLFDRARVWPSGGVLQGMGFYSLSLDEWVMAGHCAAAGNAFHARLHGELGAPAHPHDPVHDAYVGAAVEMVRAGLVDKAIDTYNRWARFAMYQPVRVVSTDPLRIDIRDCVLRIEGDQFFMEAAYA